MALGIPLLVTAVVQPKTVSSDIPANRFHGFHKSIVIPFGFQVHEIIRGLRIMSEKVRAASAAHDTIASDSCTCGEKPPAFRST